MASLLTRGLQRLSLFAPSTLSGVRHASKKATGTGGTSKTSNPKYLGIKIYGDQFAKPGAIIYRQRGAKYVRMICTEHDTPQHALIPFHKSFGSHLAHVCPPTIRLSLHPKQIQARRECWHWQRLHNLRKGCRLGRVPNKTDSPWATTAQIHQIHSRTSRHAGGTQGTRPSAG